MMEDMGRQMILSGKAGWAEWKNLEPGGFNIFMFTTLLFWTRVNPF